MESAIITTNKYFEKLNLLTSCEISDAMDACGIDGALLDIKPFKCGRKLIGPAYTIQYAACAGLKSTFKPAADYIDNVPAQSVVVIDNQGRLDCTVWGGILTQISQQNGIKGTIVHGAVRDVEFLQATDYPLFCTGYYMRSGKNRVTLCGEQIPISVKGIIINPMDIIFADDGGVLVIPRLRIAEVVYKAEKVKQTEKSISIAINAGMRLDIARKIYHYDTPWV